MDAFLSYLLSDAPLGTRLFVASIPLSVLIAMCVVPALLVTYKLEAKWVERKLNAQKPTAVNE